MKLCPGCGAQLEDNATFCTECGKRLTAPAAPAQPVYTQPAAQIVYSAPQGDTSVGTWMLTMFLAGIPLVNIICLIVWAVSSSPEKRSRKNWAIATFIWVLIDIVLVIIFSLIFGVSLSDLANSYGY